MHIDPSHSCATHLSYRLTCAEFEQLRDITPGRCHMCGKRTAAMEIDHDHNVGDWAVRGLVCRTCNALLGCIEAGKSPRTASADRYLAAAWHARQVTTDPKRKRAYRRGPCPVCAVDSAFRKDGKPTGHWSRLPGRTKEMCSASD